ncbi:cytosolic carboxypeptidase-like protein 5 [Copidosoma floridanum]|nr:cytosolic carboxypeptidase-like protein 5 [Copidosoma floridanum]
MSLEEKSKRIEQGNHLRNCLFEASENPVCKCIDEFVRKSFGGRHNMSKLSIFARLTVETEEEMKLGNNGVQENCEKQENSGIFLYIDLHSHASKKGIFMYGNHFDDPEDSSACMLLPKLMSINNPNFHFTSCNFAEKNMYIIDKRDGMSREGSGRVAVYKSFGLIHSYTLECNYNTGRVVNTVPARVKERFRKLHSQLYVPPKYNPSVFEEVGAAFGPSILDMTGHNPNSRLPNSQYRSLKGLISYLKLISSNRYQSPKTCLQKVNLSDTENDVDIDIHDGAENSEIRQCSLC